MAEIAPFWRNWIDGACVEGGAGHIPVIDPATGNQIAEQALADATDVERAEKVAKSLSVGLGIDRPDAGPTMGALVSDAQRDRALGTVARAEGQGARVVTGGRKLNRLGAFLEPTVLSGVTPDMDIAQQEVFGPVLSVLSFRDEAEAMDIAYGTEYGLVGGVSTADIDRAARAARHVRAGQVFVNEWYAGGVETPFGGYHKSGYGREKGREALRNYVQTKNVAMKLRELP